MKRWSKLLLRHPFLSQSQNLLSLSKPIRNLPFLSPLCTSTKPTTNPKTPNTSNEHQLPTIPTKDSFILETFRQRKLHGIKNPSNPTSERPGESCTREVGGFGELGLGEEVVWGVWEMGIWVPNEVQCVGVPAVLEGKSLVLSSGSGSGRTLAYLLPLIQLLRQDEASLSMKPNQPLALILCSTEEQCDEVFRTAKFLIDFARLKSARESGSSKSDHKGTSDAPIGLLIGTPAEISQQMVEGSILVDHIKYLVLEEADNMFNHGFGPEISKIVNPLKNRKSDYEDQGFQTIFITSTLTEVLGKESSPIMEHLQRDNAGKVTAMLLEMDQTEVLDIIESPENLKKKVAEAIDSLASGS